MSQYRISAVYFIRRIFIRRIFIRRIFIRRIFIRRIFIRRIFIPRLGYFIPRMFYASVTVLSYPGYLALGSSLINFPRLRYCFLPWLLRTIPQLKYPTPRILYPHLLSSQPIYPVKPEFYLPPYCIQPDILHVLPDRVSKDTLSPERLPTVIFPKFIRKFETGYASI